MMKKNQFKSFLTKAVKTSQAFALGAMLLVGTGMLKAQNDINVLYYKPTTSSPDDANIGVDVSVLDGVFGTVSVNGIVRTADFTGSDRNISGLPTSVSDYSGIQVVIVQGLNLSSASGYILTISQQQADALVAYVKQGGVLIGNMEGVKIGTTSGVDFNKYVAEKLLLQSGVNIVAAAANLSGTPNPSYAYHNNSGPLNLNASATTVVTTTTSSYFTGIPSESIIYAFAKPTSTATCGNRVLDFVAPSYPGDANALAAGIYGFAYLSGEVHGPLMILNSPSTRNNSQANINLAQMIYDFLYDPAAMKTRRAWSKTTANVNSFCPVLSLAEEPPAVQNLQVCTGTTANLNNANLEATPSEVEWHATNDVNSPVITNITAVATGTYYAFFTVASGKSRTVGSAATVQGVVCCSTGNCNPNTFVNSSDPNTIEYDNIVSTFHSTIIKEGDGTFKVWGEATDPNGTADILSPKAITPANGFNYIGTPLKATGGMFGNSSNTVFHQHALLTTDGLYVWGATNTLISSAIKNTTAFGKITVNGKTDGLPAGVIPGQVKMMFGAYGTLAIVTCSGEAWVLSFSGAKNGDGTAEDAINNVIWHRVKTSVAGNPNLDNVVAMRGNSRALFALTSTGELYTWGSGTYINSGAAANRTYATQVTVPTGVIPKMIGMPAGRVTAAQAYYLLASDGRLFCMGDNGARRLGDGTNTNRTTWIQPQKPASQGQGTGNLTNIAWISPNEHSQTGITYTGAINVLTNDRKLWAWGSNENNMIGGPTANTVLDPTYMPGNSTAANGMQLTDEIIAVETGGHTTMNIKKGDNRFGYVGHYVHGSMGNNLDTDSNVSTYSYNTAIVTVCAANVGPSVQDLQVCTGTTANLNSANLEATPSEVEWHATNDASSAVMTNITAVPAGTYYAFYTVASGKTRTMGSAVTVTGVVCCTTGDCNPNAYVNSSDPSTIEYDNIVSTFHGTIIKESNGSFKVWGQNANANGTNDLASPTAVTPANGFTYTGTPLKATTTSFAPSSTIDHQYALLTTDGLYVWGKSNILITSTIKSTTTFGKITVNGKADGLPAGVIPGQVKMMFGAYGTLAITTCSGEAWVLSFNGSKNGDGTAQNATNNAIWHRVKTSAAGSPDLNDVVAMRGTTNALFALTSTGKLYTWGTNTHINDGSVATNRTYATEVSVPAGITPKMIGMTQQYLSGTLQTYYLLATNGKLFSMGDNSSRQLGDGTTTTRTTWVQPQKITDQSGQGTGPLENIVWISPNEHEGSYIAAINVLTDNKKLWAWGGNGAWNLGGTTTPSYDPTYMPGSSTATDGMKITDNIIAVETGAHTSINIKEGSDKFGYVGHNSNGSMGNGIIADTNLSTYSYNTGIVTVCATNIGPSVQDIKTCTGTTANLNNANLATTPSEVEWHASNDASSAVMTNITAVAPGTYYAFYTVASGKQRTVGSPATVSYYLATDTDAPCYDADGDGIPDSIDLDNDNDGILDANECATNAGKIAEWNHNNSTTPWAASSVQSTYISSTSDSVTGSGITSRSLYISTSWLSGITSTNYDDAVTKNTYVEYAFTTAAFGTAVHRMYDRSWFWWTNDGTHASNKFKLAVAISSDNFATKTTVVTDVLSLQNATSSTVNNLTKYRLQPNTAYKVRVYIYGLTNPGEIIDYDDYSIMMTNFCDTDGDGIPDYKDLDSDNDGCLDAIEGSENVTTAMLVSAAPSLSVGTGSTAANQNLCAGTGCVDAQGVPTVVNAGGAADTGNNQGQGVGSSANFSVNGCPTSCYKPGITTGIALDTKVGITTLSRAGATDADNWPMTRKGGWLALESKTKGFVPNRLAFDASGNPVGIAPANFVEGMMVYDTTNKCLKVYTLKEGASTMAWHCVTTQACPD